MSSCTCAGSIDIRKSPRSLTFQTPPHFRRTLFSPTNLFVSQLFLPFIPADCCLFRLSSMNVETIFLCHIFHFQSRSAIIHTYTHTHTHAHTHAHTHKHTVLLLLSSAKVSFRCSTTKLEYFGKFFYFF